MSHTIPESLILPAAVEVVEIFIDKKEATKLKTIYLIILSRGP